jgi:hypothetical protein
MGDFQNPLVTDYSFPLNLFQDIFTSICSGLYTFSPHPNFYFIIVACLLKAGIAEPEEMSVARQQLCKQVSK